MNQKVKNVVALFSFYLSKRHYMEGKENGEKQRENLPIDKMEVLPEINRHWSMNYTPMRIWTMEDDLEEMIEDLERLKRKVEKYGGDDGDDKYDVLKSDL